MAEARGCRLRESAGERGAWQAGAGGGEHEHRARHGLPRQPLGTEVGGRRGDVEVVEVRAAEGARGGPRRRHLDHAVQPARRRVAVDRAAVPQRHPDGAVGVDREPVGEAGGPAEVDERPAPRHQTGVAVHVEDVDPAGRGVHVVHQAPVRAPADAVADGDVVEDGDDVAVRADPVQPPAALGLVVAHRPGPEPAGGVHGGVVAAPPVFRPGGQPPEGAVGAVAADPVAQVHHQAAGGARLGGADVLRRAQRPVAAAAGIQTMHLAGQDVDPEQRAGGDVPGRPLAEPRVAAERHLEPFGHPASLPACPAHLGSLFQTGAVALQPRGPVVLLNAPFAFALVLYGGIGAAALLQAGATLLSGVMHHRPAGRVAFVTADHTIGLAAGAGVWMVLSGGQPVSTSTLPAILVGTAVFVAAKFLLFAVRMRLDQTMPPDVTPGRVLRTAVEVTAMAVAVVLAVVLAAEQMALLLAVLLLPSLAAYLFLRSEAKANIGRGEAEQTARREADLRRQEHELRLQQQEVTRKLQETDKLKDDLLEMGDRQAQRLRTLIEQLLLAARIERGGGGAPSSGAEPVDADAAELVLQAATEARAGHRDHPIRVECDGGLPVHVAPDAVLQILGSLLDNACKYSPDGRLVRLLALGDGSHAVLAVEDEGAGVPPAERERIFERFTRLDKGRSGLGLGLYIARQLARAQGGDLLLTDARHAAGARFELRLPLRRRASPPVPSGDDGAPVARTAAGPP